jgi:hypothetical protein
MRRVVGMLCCALLGAVWVPAVAHAAVGTKFAVVRVNGALARGHGAHSTAKLAVGSYEVNFSTDQSACAYVATPGDAAVTGVAGPIVATVASRSGKPMSIYVQIWDQTTGVLVDRPFHVTTYCGTKPSYAVVGTDGALARGSHVTATGHLGPGRYEVFFDANMGKCAFTASLGTTGTGSVSLPGQVTVAGDGANKKGVIVNTMARTGAPADFSFHLAVDCGPTKLIGVIAIDGSTVRGANVVSSGRLSPVDDAGTYEVVFNRTVATCAYTATLGSPTFGDEVTDPVTITTATRAGNPSGVFLSVHNVDGTTRDEPFHLTVTC